MKTAHTSEQTQQGPGRGFWIALGAVWVVPLVVLLATFRWRLPAAGMRLLYKSTWVLFAGVLLSWVLLPFLLEKMPKRRRWMPIAGLAALSLASFFLLPYGIHPWEYRGYFTSRTFGPEIGWDYADGLFVSMFLHFIPVGLVGLVDGWFSGAPEPGRGRAAERSGGVPRKRTWLDDVWKGGQLSDDFYGRRGEFDRNDESRRISEDIQQFRSANPDADLSDHYYWDDLRDAETDDYLEDD